MPIYVVIASLTPVGPPLEEAMHTVFDESDRHEALPGVWFVRSPFVTSAQVRDALGIKVGGPNGIVVATRHYTGAAEADLVEKLKVWEGME